jgi:hypothetical protein
MRTSCGPSGSPAVTIADLARYVLWTTVALVCAWALYTAWDAGWLRGFDESRQAPVVANRVR